MPKLIELLIVALACAAGYKTGYQDGRLDERIGPSQTPPQAQTKHDTPSPETEPQAPPPSPAPGKEIEAAPAPPPTQLTGVPDEPKEEEKEVVPIKILAKPEAALRAFLSAPDWRARSKYVLNPAENAKDMELYYNKLLPDGEVAFKSVTVQDSRKEQGSQEEYHVYQVVTEQVPAGFPVAVVIRDGDWKVDWGTFAEFHGDLFARWAKGEMGPKGAFHLVLRLTNFAPKHEGFTAFRLDPPLPGRDLYGYVPTGSELHQRLTECTSWGKPGQALLRLQRNTDKDGKAWIEITGIQMADWWSRSD